MKNAQFMVVGFVLIGVRLAEDFLRKKDKMNEDLAKKLLVEKVLKAHSGIEEAVLAAVEAAFESGYGWGFEDAYVKDPIPEEFEIEMESRYEG